MWRLAFFVGSTSHAKPRICGGDECAIVSYSQHAKLHFTLNHYSGGGKVDYQEQQARRFHQDSQREVDQY